MTLPDGRHGEGRIIWNGSRVYALVAFVPTAGNTATVRFFDSFVWRPAVQA